MLVAEKTRHINTYIHGQGAEYLVDILRKEIPSLEIVPDESVDEDEEYSEISQTDWFREIAEK